ncbi:MAG: VOC family protein [Dehalococcoidia bacterium]|nr:VOC family protein [Dehalococcoidia bacterium]
MTPIKRTTLQEEQAMIQCVDHVEVVTPDLDASIQFYTKVLGFKLARRVVFPPSETSQAPREIACLTLGDVMLEFLEGTGAAVDRIDQVGVKLVALRVDDMEKTLQELKIHGVEPSWGPNPGATFDGIRAEIKDSHGLSIELREWRNSDSADNERW